MKTIGMLGGMSPESSLLYYRLINEETKRQLGGHHNARSILLSVDFAEVERLMGDWDRMGAMLAQAAADVEHAGADFLILCTNTMHRVADAITEAVKIPFLHIADVTATAIQASGKKRVGLLGTKFTMEQDFYAGRIKEHFGIEIVVPPAESRQIIHDCIFDELCQGIISPDSRRHYQRTIDALAEQGAEGVILGCTEIGLLISEADSSLPVFDSTKLHAKAAVEFALQDQSTINNFAPFTVRER